SDLPISITAPRRTRTFDCLGELSRGPTMNAVSLGSQVRRLTRCRFETTSLPPQRLLQIVIGLFVAISLGGCAVVSGHNDPAPGGAQQAFTLTGTIRPMAGGSGATVTLGGTSAATTTADSSGSYTFTGLANGNYTVTPSHAGFTFAPGSQTVSVNGANVANVNFTSAA